MSSLVVNLNELVDLAINPSLGTINTSLLHNLLHVIINQLHLSSSFIEFHGAGSAVIENYIVNNQHCCCGIEINEFEIKKEVDEATGSVVEKRSQIKGKETETNELTKLFTVRNVETDCKYPMGYPLSPIQVLSIEKMQKLQTNSIHDVIAKMIPSDDKFISAEFKGSSLKAMFDYINVSKRIDALEIGIRQLARIFKKIQCETDRIDLIEKEIDPLTTSLNLKVDALSEHMKKFHCKCNDNDFEENLFNVFSEKTIKSFEDLLSPLKLEMEYLKNIYKSEFEEYQRQNRQFMDQVCERLGSFKNDLKVTMKEIQEMMDAKLDKFFVPELKIYIQEMIKGLNEKIETLACKKSVAAGMTKTVVTDFNCVLCGKNVIQANACNPTKSILKKSGENHARHNDVNELQLFKLPTRLCGGYHTITTPRERIFSDRETVKIKCHAKRIKTDFK